MLPDRVSNPGPMTYESGALPIALDSVALSLFMCSNIIVQHCQRPLASASAEFYFRIDSE